MAYNATLASDEGVTLPLSSTVPVQFAQATTTTTAAPTTTTTVPVGVGGVGATGTGGAPLPRTGLSIIFTVLAGAVLLTGGTGLSRFAKAKAAQSTRWSIKYGVPYPVGTHKRIDREV